MVYFLRQYSNVTAQSSASYFLGDPKNDSLQRIYGISFPDKKQMTEYKHFLEEAAKRDHRKIGKVSRAMMVHGVLSFTSTRSYRSKSCSSSTNSVLEARSSCLMAQGFTTPLRSSCAYVVVQYHW